MPCELVQRIDLDHCYLPFVQKGLELLARCEAAGIRFYVIRGYDSPAAQKALFDQGRTTPGPIVTNAPPFYSSHNYGLAWDLCKDKDAQRAGLQPDWSKEAERDYRAMGAIAKELGLIWGGDWSKPDMPHVQWPGYVTRKQLDPLRVVALAKKDPTPLARLRRVWAEVERKSKCATS